MALPSSGVLTLNDIQTEFGGTNPIDLSDYYRGGGLVPNSAGNSAIPTSGAISVSDFYGSANLLNLDFTVRGAVVNRGNGTFTGVSIGTANASRMVVLQGVVQGTNAPPTAVTIGGISAGLVRNSGNYVAYAKVPTGTTATIVLSGGSTTFRTQIYTLNTVNTAPTKTFIQTIAVAPNTAVSSTMTQNPVDTEGVFIWGMFAISGGPGSPVRSGTGMSTSNPNGVTIRSSTGVVGTDFQYSAMGYSKCTTTNSRFARTTNNNNPGKGQGGLYSAFTYFKAN